ncbi:MAG: hypothetical protein ACTSPY_11905 [Candidatus Helarchaeota archaeon]
MKEVIGRSGKNFFRNRILNIKDVLYDREIIPDILRKEIDIFLLFSSIKKIQS